MLVFRLAPATVKLCTAEAVPKTVLKLPSVPVRVRLPLGGLPGPGAVSSESVLLAPVPAGFTARTRT